MSRRRLVAALAAVAAVAGGGAAVTALGSPANSRPSPTRACRPPRSR